MLPAPIKALPGLCLFPPVAEISKSAGLRVAGDFKNDLHNFGNNLFYKLVAK
jgi:hypothetical protein